VHTPVDGAVLCDDNNPCTTDSCPVTATACQHSDNNAATCTDNDACTTDTCSAGVCVGTPKDCTSLNSDCAAGTCANGTCQAQPTNAGGTCDDGMTACDSGGKCDANGVCVLSHDACGPLALSCSVCTSGADCYNGRLCVCQTAPAGSTPIILVNGSCKLAADECTGNPCAAGATCTDPTPDGSVNGDVKCTCPTGFEGDGKVGGTGCVDINECARTPNPCGTGTCNGASPPGSYSCTCAAGFASVTTPTGPTCVCDLSGTYALMSTSMVTWPQVNGPLSIPVIEASPTGGIATYQWSLRHHKVEANGSMSVQTITCGGTAPDFCDVYNKFAHAQYQSNQLWGKAKVVSGTKAVTASVLGVVPGGTYSEPQTVQLLGIALTDPSGQWPQCRACVGVEVGQPCTCGSTNYTVTNKATWVDADDDGTSGITNFHIPRGGLQIDGINPDPPYGYSEPTACPRLSGAIGTYTYQEWPGAVGLTQFRTNRWFVGQRTTSAITSTAITLASNNQCEIAGNVTGPASGKAKVDLRIQGCEICAGTPNSSCVPGGACSPAQVDSYDTVAPNQGVASHTFTMKKMTNIDVGAILALPEGADKDAQMNQACDEMRMASCPAGKNCTTP
jgi:hypothetical protein